jgi:hypothetical protein
MNIEYLNEASITGQEMLQALPRFAFPWAWIVP